MLDVRTAAPEADRGWQAIGLAATAARLNAPISSSPPLDAALSPALDIKWTHDEALQSIVSAGPRLQLTCEKRGIEERVSA